MNLWIDYFLLISKDVAVYPAETMKHVVEPWKISGGRGKNGLICVISDYEGLM